MAHDAHAHPNPNPQDDPPAAPLVDAATLSLIIFVVSVGAVMALYFQWENRFTEATYARDYPARSFNAAQDEALVVQRPAWVDRQAGVAAIQIDEAMRLVARDLADGGNGLPSIPGAVSAPSTTPEAPGEAAPGEAGQANETAPVTTQPQPGESPGAAEEPN